MDQDTLKKLATWIRNAERFVFFGGAGVSTESGVPDFRSASGIYHQEAGAESILTPSYLRSHPDQFYTFYRHYFMMEGILPNDCHRCLSLLEQKGLCRGIITQNVDGLHQEAGSKSVLELHGSGQHFTCLSCGAHYSIDQVKTLPSTPHCTRKGCSGLLRPDIVLYEEALDSVILSNALHWIESADLLVIGGTSLTVYPAASLIHYRNPSCRLVVINQSKTTSDNQADLVLRDSIGSVFKELTALI